MSSKSLRPSAHHFRRAGWLPGSAKVYDKWMNDLTGRVRGSRMLTDNLLPPIREFKLFIENEPTVYQEFLRMFDGMTEAPTNHVELCHMFNEIFRKAPFYGDLGPPVYMVMARIMNTQGGFSAFTKTNLNSHFKNLFDTWATFLKSKDSCYVLVDHKFDDKHWGWFSQGARVDLMAEFGERSFEQVFLCDETKPYHGFTSYEDWFNRRFREPEVDRPVTGGVDDLRFVSAPCEATAYCVQEDLKRHDELFIKDEAYSLRHLLADDPLLEHFVGGKAIQGFLNTTGYHRWHSPVNGTIKKIVTVPGTYFAQAPYTIGDEIPDADSHDAPPFLQSLQYFANTATRQLMFIKPDNEDVGLLCFISIGMTEISTSEATVYDGQHVNRGDETGMFHFGGSSFCLLFSKNSKAKIDGKYYKPGQFIKINEAIAAVEV